MPRNWDVLARTGRAEVAYGENIMRIVTYANNISQQTALNKKTNETRWPARGNHEMGKSGPRVGQIYPKKFVLDDLLRIARTEINFHSKQRHSVYVRWGGVN